jgi:hypothetical protein
MRSIASARPDSGSIRMTAPWNRARPRAGSNRFEGSAYTVFRPEALQDQLLIPSLNHETFRPEYWRNGGGGVGGPIVRNKTFFWFAGEKYTDLQPQASAFSVPSMATRAGDFSGLMRTAAPST